MSEAEVVIVGSGATGSLIAARLGAAGRKVVVLEGGPQRKLEDLYSSTIWSRRLKWAGPSVQTTGAHAVAFPFEAGWGRGGSALHHYATWLRLHPEDFNFNTLYGKGLDWPIDYEDLRPYYDRLQSDVGLSGDAELEVWRPPGAPYPMPPQPVFRQGEIIGAGFAALGQHVAPLPAAINSVPYKGRPACIQDGWCDAGCPTGALANPIVLFAEAMEKANVETRMGAHVSRLLTDPSGRRVQSVEYFDREGAMHIVEPKLVVLAAFAVETPRILLNSRNEKHPDGLANSSGLVGRYFTSHAAVNVYGLFDEETDNHMGRTGGQLLCQDGYAKDANRGFLGGHTWRIGAALKLGDLGGIANARLDLFGPKLVEFMQRAANHLASMSAIADNLPVIDNRVELSSETDQNGLPLARIVHNLGEDALRCIEAAANEGKSIFDAAGATEVWAAPVRTEHLMGGTIMGREADASVTDGYGRTHDIENLFIAGPGLFPSGGAVNPTYTASALAARTADFVIREWPGLTRS